MYDNDKGLGQDDDGENDDDDGESDDDDGENDYDDDDKGIQWVASTGLRHWFSLQGGRPLYRTAHYLHTPITIIIYVSSHP